MTFLPSVNGSAKVQCADGNGGFLDMTSATGTAAFYTNNVTATLTNTASEVSLLPTGTSAHTIIANNASIGQLYKLYGNGFYSTPGTTTNITLRIKIGGITLCSFTTSAFLNSATNLGFSLQGFVKILTAGASGFAIAGGAIIYDTAATAQTTDWLVQTTSQSVDFTTNQILDLTGQWDGASTTRSATVLNATIEKVW